MNTNQQTLTTFFLGFLCCSVLLPQKAVSVLNQEQVLQQSFENAFQAHRIKEQEREESELSKLPNLMNCNKFSYLKNCEEINKQYKKNPTAHIRVVTPKGLELNLAPGTPSYVLEHMLNPTEETAEQYAVQLEKLKIMSEKAANVFKRVKNGRGGLRGFDPIWKHLENQKLSNSEINAKDIYLTIFFNSSDTRINAVINSLNKITKIYPDLKIKIYQIDTNPDHLERLKSQGLELRMLTEAEQKRLPSLGIDNNLTIWFSNEAEQRKIIHKGTLNQPQLRAKLIEISAPKRTPTVLAELK